MAADKSILFLPHPHNLWVLFGILKLGWWELVVVNPILPIPTQDAFLV